MVFAVVAPKYYIFCLRAYGLSRCFCDFKEAEEGLNFFFSP